MPDVTTNSPAAGASEAPASADTSSNYVPSIEDIMSFDPFAESDNEDSQQAGGEPDPAPSVTTATSPQQNAPTSAAPSGEAALTPSTVTPPVQQPPAVPPEMQILRDELARMRTEMELLRKQPQQAAPATPPANPEIQRLAQQYSFPIPDSIMQAMASDDASVRSRGVSALIQGLGVRMHQNVLQEVRQIVAQQVPQVVQNRESVQRTAQGIREDFYGTFKELNNPVLYPLVQQTTAQVMQELGATQWSQAVRDAVGTRVKQQLASVLPAFMPQQQPVQQPSSPAAPARQPFMSGNGSARPAVGPTDPNSSKSIAATLGF